MEDYQGGTLMYWPVSTATIRHYDTPTFRTDLNLRIWISQMNLKIYFYIIR